jgi:hypothetical protein
MPATGKVSGTGEGEEEEEEEEGRLLVSSPEG